MSDEVLAPILAVAILVALALWVPALHVCDGCWQRFRGRRSVQREMGQATPEPEYDGVREVA